MLLAGEGLVQWSPRADVVLATLNLVPTMVQQRPWLCGVIGRLGRLGARSPLLILLPAHRFQRGGFPGRRGTWSTWLASRQHSASPSSLVARLPSVWLAPRA